MNDIDVRATQLKNRITRDFLGIRLTFYKTVSESLKLPSSPNLTPWKSSPRKAASKVVRGRFDFVVNAVDMEGEIHGESLVDNTSTHVPM